MKSFKEYTGSLMEMEVNDQDITKAITNAESSVYNLIELLYIKGQRSKNPVTFDFAKKLENVHRELTALTRSMMMYKNTKKVDPIDQPHPLSLQNIHQTAGVKNGHDPMDGKKDYLGKI